MVESPEDKKNIKKSQTPDHDALSKNDLEAMDMLKKIDRFEPQRRGKLVSSRI